MIDCDRSHRGKATYVPPPICSLDSVWKIYNGFHKSEGKMCKNVVADKRRCLKFGSIATLCRNSWIRKTKHTHTKSRPRQEEDNVKEHNTFHSPRVQWTQTSHMQYERVGGAQCAVIEVTENRSHRPESHMRVNVHTLNQFTSRLFKYHLTCTLCAWHPFPSMANTLSLFILA